MTKTIDAQDESPKSLFDMVKAAEAASQAPKEPDAATEPAPEQDAEVAEDQETETEGEPESDSEAEGDEQGSSERSKEASLAHQFLARLGYDVDGVSEEELIAEVKRRFEAKPEPAPTKPQLEPKVDIVSATPKEEEKPKPETQKQAESRRIAKLYCDPRLESLVDYNKSGRAIAKEGTGDEGAAAAKQVNEYMRDYRERMQKIGEDPIGFLEEGGLVELVQREIQAGIERHESERRKLAEEENRKLVQLSEQQTVDKFFEEHNSEIFVTGKDGKPKFIGGGPQLSELGLALKAEYEELFALNPNAIESKVLEKAYKNAKRLVGEPKPEEPKKPLKEVAEEKKKRFLDKRTAPPRHETTPSAPSKNEQPSGGSRLVDLILADPANDDNPAVLKLRGSAR